LAYVSKTKIKKNTFSNAPIKTANFNNKKNKKRTEKVHFEVTRTSDPTANITRTASAREWAGSVSALSGHLVAVVRTIGTFINVWLIQRTQRDHFKSANSLFNQYLFFSILVSSVNISLISSLIGVCRTEDVY